MSRSHKKYPIMGNADTSDKAGKRRANRVFRRRNKQLVHRALDDVQFFELRELSNVWDMPKDGKRWCGPERVRWWAHLTYADIKRDRWLARRK